MKKISAAEILLTTCSDSKKDENILIVTDPASYDVAKIMWDALESFPNRSMVMMSERNMHGEQPPECIAKAMFAADVIFGCTKFSLFHSQARKDAVANGARFVNMVDYSIEMMEKAIKGMLTKNRLGRAMYKKLFVYEGSEHPHMAQKPKEIKVERN